MTESVATAADRDHKHHGNIQPKSACEKSRPRYNFQRNSTKASAADEIQCLNLSFPRETRLYTDANLLKTHLFGSVPINKKNVHCDWRKTRDGADLVDEPVSVTLMHKKAYEITWITCTAVYDIKAQTLNCTILT